MTSTNQIILSQLTPPASRSSVLFRERVNRLLEGSLEHRLTLLVAETGFGKTTSLLAFLERAEVPQVFWFSVRGAERDPRLFLSYLFSAFSQRGLNLGQEALRLLANTETDETDALVALVNTLSQHLPGPSLLVLDDFQSVRESRSVVALVDWFVDHLPRELHLIISSRVALSFSSLNRWRLKGEVLELGQDELAFSEKETASLFRESYKVALPEGDIRQLHERTEGWAIGLQAVWQTLRVWPEDGIRRIFSEEGGASLENLFDYLAEEVLDKLEPAQQEFLKRTSVLSFLDSDVCDFLLDCQDSLEMLAGLHAAGLFVDQLRPGIYRYHHLFRDFLLNRLGETPDLAREIHRKVGSYFLAHQYWDGAISHLLSAGDYAQVAHILEEIGDRLIQSGMVQSIRYWVTQLPEVNRAQFAYGQYLMGQVARYENNFDQSLEYYRSAQRLYQARGDAWGLSLALRGQAQVYLDTIRPINASQLLSRALSLMDPKESPQDVAGLLIQIAENQVNAGETAQAELNLRRSYALTGEENVEGNYIQARLLLRTGRLQEGIALLTQLEPTGGDLKTRLPRFHREASLLLSLFYCFLGDEDKAAAYARKGQELAENLHSPIVRSIGSMRLGHAMQLHPDSLLMPWDIRHIREYYDEAIRDVDIVRIHVEPLWGICRLLGYNGQLSEAKIVGKEALSIASSAGDEWIGMLVRISLGASQAMAGEYEEASQQLAVGESIALRVGDPLCRSAALLWQAYTADKQGFPSSSMLFLEQALALIEEHHYDFLLKRATILGSDDPALFIPLLLKAKSDKIHPEFVSRILSEMGLGESLYHPGYSLSLRCLGPFEVFLGRMPVAPEAWKREKARQLLQVLALQHGRGLTREQIGVLLWPDADGQTATNNLKVVMSALNQALEPERPSGTSPLFVIRQQDQYLLNPDIGIRYDYLRFERLALSSRLEDKREAVGLYRGRLLEGEAAQEWFMAEVQYFHRLFLDATARVIEDDIQSGRLEQALDLANRLLQIDPEFEAGYLFQMRVYHALGNMPMVYQVYRQGRETAARIFGDSQGSPELTELFQRLTR